MWIFDQSDGSARLLRSRCGHDAPPTRIRFCSAGGDGLKLLSGGMHMVIRDAYISDLCAVLLLRTGQHIASFCSAQRRSDECRAVTRYRSLFLFLSLLPLSSSPSPPLLFSSPILLPASLSSPPLLFFLPPLLKLTPIIIT